MLPSDEDAGLKIIFLGPLGLCWLRCGGRWFLSGEREPDIAGITPDNGVRVKMDFLIAFAVGLNAPASDFHPIAKFPAHAGPHEIGLNLAKAEISAR
jgi:hypothetical protein